MDIEQLGSTAMQQMIYEARSLTQIDFSSNNYPRVYLVYDPDFSLHLLHNGWEQVPMFLQVLFDFVDPSTRSSDNQYIKCLSWLIDIPYNIFVTLMNEKKFILTENFTYKLFHIHERKLTKLALIIEGETGVGKTFLLQFYSSLLNANILYGKLDNKLSPRILERTSLWLVKDIIENILEKKPNLLNKCLREIILNSSNDDDDDNDIFGLNSYQFSEQNNTEDTIRVRNEPIDHDLLTRIKTSLENFEFDKNTLQKIWKIIITKADTCLRNLTKKLIKSLHDFIVLQLINSPLIIPSSRLKILLDTSQIPTRKLSIEMFDEFILHSQIEPLFYRLLIHPGITEEQIEKFLSPIAELARQMPSIELVVFFDEVNTSSCLGLFKEMFMDGTLHGTSLPKNIFFTAAINPAETSMDTSENSRSNELQVQRRDYLVHQLPQSLDCLKVSYGILNSSTLTDYVKQKIALFTVISTRNSNKQMSLELYIQEILTQAILSAQTFCENRLGKE